MKTLDDITGAYGQDWVTGVLAEHVHLAVVEGNAVIHITSSGKTYVAPPNGGPATPVLCGEIVPIYTEDGTIDGRCGAPVLHNDFACPGHAAQINEYRTSRYDHLYDTEEF